MDQSSLCIRGHKVNRASDYPVHVLRLPDHERSKNDVMKWSKYRRYFGKSLQYSQENGQHNSWQKSQ